MKKNISVLLLIVSLFAIASTTNSIFNDTNKIMNICCIIFICILQIAKYNKRINNTIITVIQVTITILAMIYGFAGLEYLLPVLVFELLEGKLSTIVCMVISLLIIALITKENMFNISIYTVITSLYLYQVKKQYKDNEELKEFNKGARYERHIMEEKISNLERYLQQNNIVASLRERNFIAQKLHDHLGHRITSSLLQLEVTKETLGNDNELSKKYLVSAMENLREGMEEIRVVLSNIKPRDKVMAIEDIKEELLNFQYSSGIKTVLKIDGDTDKIKLNIWMVIEANLKEALTNAGKYSGATKIKVSFLIYNKVARIEVSDNGKGCLNIKKGLGLRGMEERMRGIGGRIDYRNDQGFIINMMLNLED